jgi:hypothetical protein
MEVITLAGYFILAAFMLYGPYGWCWFRKENKRDYGLHWEMDRLDLLALFLLTVVTLLPLTFIAVNWPGQNLPRHIGSVTFFRLATSGLIAAIVEETFFRGLIHTIIRKHSGPFVTIFSVSLLFALCHLFLAMHWLRLATFFPALVMGFLREKSGSVFPGIIYHGIGNLWAIWFFPGF